MPNSFKLNFLSDEITFVYVNCVIAIGPEHPIVLHFYTRQPDILLSSKTFVTNVA